MCVYSTVWPFCLQSQLFETVYKLSLIIRKQIFIEPRSPKGNDRSPESHQDSVVKSGNISNSSKLSCMSLLPASMNRIRSRTAEKKLQHRFSYYKSIRIFPDTQGQLTPVVRSSQISNSHACHCYLQLWKGTDEKQPRKSEDTVFPFIILSFTMETSDLSWSNFKIIKALMYVIFTCKIEKNPIKNSREKVETSFIRF